MGMSTTARYKLPKGYLNLHPNKKKVNCGILMETEFKVDLKGVSIVADMIYLYIRYPHILVEGMIQAGCHKPPHSRHEFR